MQSWIFVSLMLSGADALRRHRSKTTVNSTSTFTEDLEVLGSRGQVANLYTYGAPKVSAPALHNPLTSDGCFPGSRLVMKRRKLIHDVDMVPALMKTLPYAHARIAPTFMDQKRVTKRECGWRGRTVEFPSIKLHSSKLHAERTPGYLPELRDVSQVALAVSYKHDTAEAAAFVARAGYRLVGTALDRDEASHLIQNPRNGDCFVTFEGSDRFSDWIENAQIIRTPFCGLGQKVHTGFKKAVMGIVATPMFDQGVRPKLGHCRKVEAVGHSLGGAIATLFTACAHNTVAPGATGYDEWKHFWWTKKETKIMDAIA